MLRIPIAFAVLLFLLIVPGQNQAGVVDFQVNGNEASATIELPGDLRAELTLRFEQVIGLSEQNLGISVQTVGPLSPSLLGRLPNATEFAVPSGFPVMVSIEPPAAGGLTFEGVVEIELYTANLQYVMASPLRLFRSSEGELFRDITDEVSGGSYRVRGSGGTYSDFLIVADTRTLPAAIEHKFDRLEGVLVDHDAAIDAVLAGQLDAHVAAARSQWDSGNPGAAIAEIRDLEAAVKAGASAGQIPNVWRSARDLDNVAGVLRAEARTLRFSLGQSGAGLL